MCSNVETGEGLFLAVPSLLVCDSDLVCEPDEQLKTLQFHCLYKCRRLAIYMLLIVSSKPNCFPVRAIYFRKVVVSVIHGATCGACTVVACTVLWHYYSNTSTTVAPCLRGTRKEDSILRMNTRVQVGAVRIITSRIGRNATQPWTATSLLPVCCSDGDTSNVSPKYRHDMYLNRVLALPLSTFSCIRCVVPPEAMTLYE